MTQEFGFLLLCALCGLMMLAEHLGVLPEWIRSLIAPRDPDDSTPSTPNG